MIITRKLSDVFVISVEKMSESPYFGEGVTYRVRVGDREVLLPESVVVEAASVTEEKWVWYEELTVGATYDVVYVRASWARKEGLG